LLRRVTYQKNSVSSPQSATLTSSTDHSEAFSESNLPSLATLAIITGHAPLKNQYFLTIAKPTVKAVTRRLHRTEFASNAEQARLPGRNLWGGQELEPSTNALADA
jgi:hypothetical protein